MPESCHFASIVAANVDVQTSPTLAISLKHNSQTNAASIISPKNSANLNQSFIVSNSLKQQFSCTESWFMQQWFISTCRDLLRDHRILLLLLLFSRPERVGEKNNKKHSIYTSYNG